MGDGMTARWECILEYTGRTGLKLCRGYVDCNRIVCPMTKGMVAETAQMGNIEENVEKDTLFLTDWIGTLCGYIGIY